MNREEKAAAISELDEGIGQATNAFVIDFKGITVPQVTELRRQVRETNSKLRRRQEHPGADRGEGFAADGAQGAVQRSDGRRVQHDRRGGAGQGADEVRQRRPGDLSSRARCSTGRSCRRTRSRPSPTCRRARSWSAKLLFLHAVADPRPGDRAPRQHPQPRGRPRPDRQAEAAAERSSRSRGKRLVRIRALPDGAAHEIERINTFGG